MGLFQATTRFQESDVFQGAMKNGFEMHLRVNSSLSGFRL